MESRRLQVVADANPPASGPWSPDATATPLAIQVLVGGHRLIEFQSGRTLETASSVQVADGRLGDEITSFPARVLGPRLANADTLVEVQRHESPGAVWLDMAHHGWSRAYGLIHQRRLYLDLEAGDLRGEDRLTPTARAQGPDGRHFVSYALRFQLHPGVRALVAQDRRSVLLRIPGEAEGWVLPTTDWRWTWSLRPGRIAQDSNWFYEEIVAPIPARGCGGACLRRGRRRPWPHPRLRGPQI
jgi:uncharacterized heparinase superfamily protein